MDLERVHHLLTIEDPSFVREIQLDAATYSIGRHSSNDIVLSCQKTSRNHATLLRRTDVKTNQCSYWVLDGDLQGNRSRNGIYVNGKKSLVHELQPGDVVQFSGDASIRYRTAAVPLENNLVESNNSSLTQASDKAIASDTFINRETIVTPPEPKSINNYHSNKPSNIPPASAPGSLAESSPQPIIEIDLYGNISYINSAGAIDFPDLHQQKLKHPLLENLIAQYNKGHDNVIDREVAVGDKTFRQIAFYLPEKKVIRNYLTDITQQKTLENELWQAKHLYYTVTQQITEGAIVINSATKQIVEANYSCSKLLGYSNAELLQMNIYELVSESEKFAPALRTVITDKKGFEGEYLLRHKDNHQLKTIIKLKSVDFASNEKICLIIYNSEPISATELERQRSANLYKKELFNQQLLTAIANAKRSQKLLAVMFCQLNFLPDIHATIGTEQSENLLLTLEKRLSSCMRAGDSVVRWQEDRFALLLPQVRDVEEITQIVRRIAQSTDCSFTLGETQATIKSTTGIAVYPQDGSDPEILLASANTALERANHHGNSYQFFDDAMNSQALVALELEGLLQQALDKEEFQLYYQPQINVHNGKIEAIEALLRWYHPEMGLVAPGNFIRLAEKTKLIVPIGEWAIYTACKQYREWHQDLPSSKITVSLSLIQFQQPNLPQKVAEILAETELNPSLLELEISAATLIDNVDRSKHTIERLKALGVKIAVDGLTGGFSALEYLKQIPLDTLKIDRFLIQQLTDSPQDLAIVSALIELGKGFNLRLVAEGVETEQQVELLRSLDCHQMQGFWFSRPLAAEEAKKLLPIDRPELASEGATSEIGAELDSNDLHHDLD